MKALFIFFSLLSSFTYGEILELTHFSQMESHLTPDTLLILDVDDTLLIPTHMLGCDEWFHARQDQYLHLGFNASDSLEKTLAEWEAIRHLSEMEIVEEGTAEYVETLQERGYALMGLTTQGLALSTRTRLQLLEQQIDLSSTAPSDRDYLLCVDGHGAFFRAGILFTSGTHKGRALFQLFEKMGYFPKKILFVNDKQSHLESVEETAVEQGIPFLGLRYAYSDKRKEAFDPEIAHYQLLHSHFHHILSDEEAKNGLLNTSRSLH